MPKPNAKRSRPYDTTTPTGDSKRVKPGTSQRKGSASYAASFRANELFVAVMTEPYHDLTAEQATGIRTALKLKFEDELLEPSTTAQTAKVHFRGKAHFSEGVLKLWCEDDYALGWLRRAVSDTASQIPGTKLVVRPQAEIQRRILCGLFIPEPNRQKDKLRRLLALHNPTVNVNSWSLVKAERQTERETPGVHLLLRVPESDVDKIKQRERL
ncbi:Uncharacterized protein OBRU01_20550 [Operophtera brumata]|uniref:DUF4780 domain-containing protein n=1 Tax=Operophtera brumata TaxID=104452 RepID=A0A0L7KN09_OPEBR|nr:Uncharacterized protein OBRU01_20550 [Operophtera brumata]